MAGKKLSKLGFGVFFAGFEDLDRGHDKAGSAEAALYGGLLHEGLLDVREFAVGADKGRS